MSFKRYNIQLAYKEPLSPSLQGKLTAMENVIKAVLGEAVKINAGLANEEMTVTAKYHICRHDEGKSCKPEVEI